MPTARHVHAVVKSVKSTGYDSFLQKIKRNNIKQPAPTPILPGCKNCNSNSFLKKVGPSTYDTYLNSIKSNIVKNKHSIGINLDCNCYNPPVEPIINILPTIYYLEYNVFLDGVKIVDGDIILKNDDQLLLDYSPTTNIVPIRTMITKQIVPI